MEAGRAAVGSTCQVADNIHPEEVHSCHAVGRSKTEERRRSNRLWHRLDHRDRCTMLQDVEGSLEVGSWEERIVLPCFGRLGRNRPKFKAALFVDIETG